jgi:hypothetical protein
MTSHEEKLKSQCDNELVILRKHGGTAVGEIHSGALSLSLSHEYYCIDNDELERSQDVHSPSPLPLPLPPRRVQSGVDPLLIAAQGGNPHGSALLRCRLLRSSYSPVSTALHCTVLHCTVVTLQAYSIGDFTPCVILYVDGLKKKKRSARTRTCTVNQREPGVETTTL